MATIKLKRVDFVKGVQIGAVLSSFSHDTDKKKHVIELLEERGLVRITPEGRSAVFVPRENIAAFYELPPEVKVEPKK